MRLLIVLSGTALLAACAQPQHSVASGDDILRGPSPDATLGEQISGEFDDGGCLQSGNLGDHRCEERLEIIAPPKPLPPSPAPAPPPTSDDD